MTESVHRRKINVR